jgi:hypothetical protein
MSIFLIARVPPLTKFRTPEEQQIKGLNFETIATISFPPPSWLYNPKYATLQPKEHDENVGLAPFSLNLSIYDQTPELSDWNDLCFFLYGLVYLYALTWGISPENDSDTVGEIQNYTIPTLIVRDHCYQPYIHHSNFITLHRLTSTYSAELLPRCSMQQTASPILHLWPLLQVP